MGKLVFLLLALSACTKSNNSSAIPANETPPPDSAAVAAGIFASGPYGSVTGSAAVFVSGGKYTLALGNMLISNGPDLHVYLSLEPQPVHFVDLGKLKSTAGNQLYEIAGKPDLSIYSYVLIHCQQYNHLFGTAVLK